MSDRIAVTRKGLIEQGAWAVGVAASPHGLRHPRLPWRSATSTDQRRRWSAVDAVDEKIIAELTRNARMPHSELAGKVLLSRNAVRQRASNGWSARATSPDTPSSARARTPAMSSRRWSSSTARTACAAETSWPRSNASPRSSSARSSAATSTSRCVWRRPRWNAYASSGRTSPRCPAYGTRSPRSPCPASSTARKEGGVLRHRGEQRRCLVPVQQPVLDHEVGAIAESGDGSLRCARPPAAGARP